VLGKRLQLYCTSIIAISSAHERCDRLSKCTAASSSNKQRDTGLDDKLPGRAPPDPEVSKRRFPAALGAKDQSTAVFSLLLLALRLLSPLL
jgi:hypothetical protein